MTLYPCCVPILLISIESIQVDRHHHLSIAAIDGVVTLDHAVDALGFEDRRDVHLGVDIHFASILDHVLEIERKLVDERRFEDHSIRTIGRIDRISAEDTSDVLETDIRVRILRQELFNLEVRGLERCDKVQAVGMPGRYAPLRAGVLKGWE